MNNYFEVIIQLIKFCFLKKKLSIHEIHIDISDIWMFDFLAHFLF